MLPLGWGWGRLGKQVRAGALSRVLSQAKPISPELSALAVYCCAARLRTLDPGPGPPQPCNIGSLSERKARKFTREAGRNQRVGIWEQEGMEPCGLGDWMGILRLF